MAKGKKGGTRNPPWARDELILALDLYFDHKPSSISKTHPAVIEVSKLLNKLPIHGERPDAGRFRNPNGVYMKLCNFLRYDPTYTGTGLQRGAKAEEEVWNEFAGDRALLKSTANAIRAAIASPAATSPASGGGGGDKDADDDDAAEFPEGKVLYRLHRTRERSAELRERARAAELKKSGHLRCAACGFDFAATYGEIGNGFIECHHTIPVSELKPGAVTKLQDIALLCSNCHRMVHRRRPWLKVSNLELLVASNSSTAACRR